VFPLALVFAFSVGNLPEALSSAAGMRIAGRSYRYIFLLWSAIAIGAAVAIAAGYVGFGSLSEAWPPRLQAFGAGALLAMTAETMIPEAFHNSPRFYPKLAYYKRHPEGAHFAAWEQPQALMEDLRAGFKSLR
jgi:zinc transporter, ZIP family